MSTTVIPISVTPVASVIVASGIVTVKSSPCTVIAIVFPGLVKSEEAISPETTWYNKTSCNTSTGTSSNVAKSLSDKNVANASFVGANTVKGPSPLSVLTKSAVVNAATKELNSGVAIASSTIFGCVGIISLLSSSLQAANVNNRTIAILIFLIVFL